MRNFFYETLGLLACALLTCATAWAQPDNMTTLPDLPYAETEQRTLLLDLYLPDDPASAPLIVWIHGGAWRFGDKSAPPILGIVEQGFAVASLDFRSSTEAIFPAPIHDIKAAVRYLRAQAASHGYDGDRIVLWGHSSGAHLATLTAVTAGNPALEGELGDHTDTDSAVQAVIAYAGPSNLTTILYQSTEHGVSVRAPSLALLLGVEPGAPGFEQQATLASPALQLGATAPPLLLVHGVQDNQVPINQAIELELAYQRRELDVTSAWLLNAGHGGSEYYSAAALARVTEFLHRVL